MPPSTHESTLESLHRKDTSQSPIDTKMDNGIMKTTQIRKVHFSPHVHGRMHISRSDITIEEKRNAWYSSYDLFWVQRECLDTIEWMRNSSSARNNRSGSDDESDEEDDDETSSLSSCEDEAETFCTRGLEFRAGAGVRLKKKFRYTARDAVIDHQEREWYRGRDPTPESTAQVYKQHTEQSSRLARLMAIMDERFVHSQEAEQQRQQQEEVRRQISSAAADVAATTQEGATKTAPSMYSNTVTSQSSCGYSCAKSSPITIDMAMLAKQIQFTMSIQSLLAVHQLHHRQEQQHHPASRAVGGEYQSGGKFTHIHKSASPIIKNKRRPSTYSIPSPATGCFPRANMAVAA